MVLSLDVSRESARRFFQSCQGRDKPSDDGFGQPAVFLLCRVGVGAGRLADEPLCFEWPIDPAQATAAAVGARMMRIFLCGCPRSDSDSGLVDRLRDVRHSAISNPSDFAEDEEAARV